MQAPREKFAALCARTVAVATVDEEERGGGPDRHRHVRVRQQGRR